ncbi:TlpA family protein disulfide reductase [Nocardioides soli]|uniref:Thiol-disulfide isomerase/thioredoxin n=1 Tax=Nocardioides soli TaxID=1036020 RepID=A0A7W4VVR7_9ACTN|nr:TlpA disulfide reductase family protein [Nocardioides soli]MBB3042555.1 thiol-disulfide isomerase/thioredoxin [Nocardioides soli]
MRRALSAALVAALLALSGCTDDVPGPGRAQIDVDTPQLRQLRADAGIEACAPGDGDPAASELPDVTLPCLGGGDDVDLASLRGPLVINVWAAWCQPCAREMPALAKFYDRYGDQVSVIGIDYQDPQTGPALELAQRSGVTYPLLADPQGDLQAQEPFPLKILMPSFLFVDEQGAATYTQGGIDSVDEMVDLVEEHLGVTL